MTLLRDLLNAGVLPSDAQILESEFANEPDFLDGMEQIARCLAMGQPPNLFPPSGEPWRSIHGEMLHNGQAPDAAFNQALATWPVQVQAAISGAVSQRMVDINQWMQQLQQSTSKKRKSADYVKILANLGYVFRYNTCTNNIETNGVPVSDPIMATIRSKIRDAGIVEINVVEDAIMAHAWTNRYHPIKDYLTSLKYQGGNEINILASYFVDERGIIELWLKRWLIGACARVMAGEQNRMLVLDGHQKMGKDYFVKWLCSPMPEYFQEGAIMPDEKDHRLRLLSTWIWDVNELGNTTRRSDREALKAFLTIQTVRERRPYGHFDTQGQAMTSFIGTVNNEGGILNDPTGNRRFMIATMKSMDWNYTQIDVDQVWAQAFELYLAGEHWDLKDDELNIAEEINEEYQVIDIVEEAIKELFVITPGDTSDWMASYEIMEILKAERNSFLGIRGGGLKPGVEVDTRRLSSALTKLGLKKTYPVSNSLGDRRRGYYGIKRR